jgi:hypothetical protein
MDKPAPENPTEDLEKMPTMLESPESVSARLNRLEEKARQIDEDVTKTILEVNALKPNAEERQRANELSKRENSAKTKFYGVMGAVEGFYWKAREIGQSPEKVQAIRLIAKARQDRWNKKTNKGPSDAERTQKILAKIKDQPWEAYDKIKPMIKKVEADNPLVRSIDHWTPTLDDNDDKAIAYLVDIKMKMDDMRDEYAQNPSAENVKKEMKLIFEITGTAPPTDEEVEGVWKSGIGGAIMRSGEERINDYFREMSGAYPEVYMELNKKRAGLSVKEDEREGVAGAKKILDKIDYLPHVEGGYGEGGKTLPPPGARKRAKKQPEQPEA